MTPHFCIVRSNKNHSLFIMKVLILETSLTCQWLSLFSKLNSPNLLLPCTNAVLHLQLALLPSWYLSTMFFFKMEWNVMHLYNGIIPRNPTPYVCLSLSISLNLRSVSWMVVPSSQPNNVYVKSGLFYSMCDQSTVTVLRLLCYPPVTSAAVPHHF